VIIWGVFAALVNAQEQNCQDDCAAAFAACEAEGLEDCLAVDETCRQSCVEAEAATRPNILVILIDDMGYGDTNVYGATDTRTPNINRLAAQGVRFTDAYSSGNVCTPTRAGLMSGQYQQRIGVEDVGRVMPRSVTTLPQRLRPAGYATGMFGKWHLGDAPGFRPWERGFEEFFGFPTAWCNFPCARSPLRVTPSSTRQEPLREYYPDALAKEAVRYVRAHRGEPWFYYMAYNMVHVPVEVPAQYLNRFRHIPDLRRRTYAATLAAVDDGIGDVVAALADTGQLHRTLIVFASDNGGPTGTKGSANGSRNTPLRGRKGQTFEGGIRVNMIMQWPGVLPAGSVYRKPVITMDITATALAAAGMSGARDGVNLRPYLTGNSATPHPLLFWRNRDLYGTHAVRQGPWKLVWSTPTRRYHLFNLADDLREQHDLAGSNPAKLAELRGLYNAWSAGVDADARLAQE